MFVKLTLALSAFGLLAFGLAMTVAPEALLGPLGLSFDSAAAVTEIRAFYGGLELGLGAAILYCLLRPTLRRLGLQLSALCYGCIAIVRALGMVIDGSGGTFLWAALIFEAVLAVANIAALRHAKSAA